MKNRKIMYPVTPQEKSRAILRIRASASSLIHDQVITEQEFRMIMRRAFDQFGHPSALKELIEWDTNQNNGEPSTSE